MKYFYINNIKFNYNLEFQSNAKQDQWKINAPLIEYCESLGVNIPHYCYNKNLSISGNCRMCLVELENAPKPVVSCAMSAKSCLNNVKVFTNSPLVKKARENVLEFLLLNHPLDCPICDQGGECDLQDQSLFFGTDRKRFYNFKRTVTDKNIGVIVKTVMILCIRCNRCVKFSDEIAGVPALGMFSRGLKSEIGFYVNKIQNRNLLLGSFQCQGKRFYSTEDLPFIEKRLTESARHTPYYCANPHIYPLMECETDMHLLLTKHHLRFPANSYHLESLAFEGRQKMVNYCYIYADEFDDFNQHFNDPFFRKWAYLEVEYSYIFQDRHLDKPNTYYQIRMSSKEFSLESKKKETSLEQFINERTDDTYLVYGRWEVERLFLNRDNDPLIGCDNYKRHDGIAKMCRELLTPKEGGRYR